MKKLTKKEVRQQRAEYRAALAEGRVVRYGVPGDSARTFRTFHTAEEAQAFADSLKDDASIEATVLKVEPS